MDKETQGAWIIHHGQKVRGDANGAAEFSAIDTAAKAGTLLSQLARGFETTITPSAVNAYAVASGLNPRLELAPILKLLQDQKLIDISATEVAVLGATSRGALSAAANIFADLSPTKEEEASLAIAELTSESPQAASETVEFVGDTFKIPQGPSQDLIKRAELIGFVDAEGDGSSRLLFNGNLFRVAGPVKVAKVLSTLASDERARLTAFNEKLRQQGCITLTSAARELGETLISKLRAIGLLDVSVVVNESGSTGFVTRPDAFHKFVSPLVDDAFDLAKALVAALSYGIQRSSRTRGQIWGIELLLTKLIHGGTVGPAPAIGQDYKYLEQRGVVEVFPQMTSFSMRLLKPDIGQIALQVLKSGNAMSAQVLDNLPSSPMAGFRGPEPTRSRFRKSDRGKLKKTDQDVLHVLRTRGILR